jgi:hypothetical protein
VKRNHTPLLEKPFDKRSTREVEYLDNKPTTFVFLQGEEFYDYDHDDDFWLVEMSDSSSVPFCASESRASTKTRSATNYQINV